MEPSKGRASERNSGAGSVWELTSGSQWAMPQNLCSCVVPIPRMSQRDKSKLRANRSLRLSCLLEALPLGTQIPKCKSKCCWRRGILERDSGVCEVTWPVVEHSLWERLRPRQQDSQLISSQITRGFWGSSYLQHFNLYTSFLPLEFLMGTCIIENPDTWSLIFFLTTNMNRPKPPAIVVAFALKCPSSKVSEVAGHFLEILLSEFLWETENLRLWCLHV